MIRSAETIRVLLIADEYPPTICGIGDYTANLARALSEKGVEVGVLTRTVPRLPQRETIDGVAIHRLTNGWTAGDLRPVLNEAGAFGRGTIVHVQYPSLTNYQRRVMINLLPPVLRTVQRSNPVVVTMHGFHEHRLRWRLRVLPMLWANSALVFVHPRDREQALRWAPLSRSKSTLIPIASNVPALQPDPARRQRVRAELGLGPDEAVAVYFGEVRPDKGLHILLDAVEAMHRRRLPARAMVISTVGTHPHVLTAYEREMLSRLETGNREGWAMLVRAETPHRAAEILKACDAAAFPFTLGAAENRGSLIAAVVNGLPVLTTRGISTPADYEQTHGVETVDASDVAGFATRLETILSRPEIRGPLGDKAAAAGKSFSWSAIADQSIEVYRKCLRA